MHYCPQKKILFCSRSKNEEVADLNVIARRLLENTTTPNSSFSNRTLTGPTRAYVEEVVDDIRSGNVRECPICLESADDPVITPCAHRMCRECLLASWQSPSGGPCPICRSTVSRSGLMTCPSVNLFRLDLERNWKEPCKVLKLMNFLESLRRSGLGEKSIVFSQWTSFLDLLQAPLMSRKIGFLRYDGSLAQKQRERVLKEFNECSDKPVIFGTSIFLKKLFT
ncbi:hypothetical protein QJS04_geneDACA000350 [Acorus gramineus]|uniref:RING-type domain-containing protein n=1 Tax=Acorus gramineus TaxID=55184 RepID=A0AAV9ARG6_ACOGR|nr:hypothetical protein QJS04_geneDACA000350 [Acorus gramineus]